MERMVFPASSHLETYARMEMEGLQPTVSLTIAALRDCSRLTQLHTGRQIHCRHVLLHQGAMDPSVATSLVEMYVKCGSIAEARTVFEGIVERSTALWNCIITGYANSGEAETALAIFDRMLAALKACIRLAEEEQGAITKSKSLERGKRIHSQARRSGIDRHRFVASSLVSMYSKCGSMADARQVFESMVERDSVSWNCIIQGYAESGDGERALDFFWQMLAALKACASLSSRNTPQLVQGELVKLNALVATRRVHSQAEADGLASEVFVATSLVDGYCKCGSLHEARRVFEMMSNPTVVSWTTIILGHADSQQADVALDLYTRMLERGFTPNYVTYVAALKACSILAEKETAAVVQGKMVKLRALARGREIHRQAWHQQQLHIFVANSLVDMYAKCGDLEESRRVFESIPNKSVVSWTAMILGYAENGQGESGLELYFRMQEEGCPRDAIAVTAAAKACSSMAAKEEAKVLHAREYLEMETLLDCGLGGSIVAMFSECGSAADAREVFDRMPQRDIASWNSLIMGYTDNGEADLALQLYQRMVDDDRVVPDGVTYVALLKACAGLQGGDQETAKLLATKAVHAQAARAGVEFHTLVANTLIDTYAKAGVMSDSWRVFESMNGRSAVSWTAIISGYVRAGEGKLARESYRLMLEDGVSLDAASFIAVLKACRAEAVVETGRRIEAQVRDAAALVRPAVANCLIDFYGKCGSMHEADQVFDSMKSSDRQLITWNSLIDGYSRQGDFDKVLELFQEMQKQPLEPDDVTFVSILAAASHAGLVDRGKECFDSMSSKHGIAPGVKHYACMVDLLGRANRLDEALETASNSSDAVVWMTLLSACHKWGDVKVGRVAFDSLLRVEKDPVSACVLMSNLYAAAGMWEESRAIRETLVA